MKTKQTRDGFCWRGKPSRAKRKLLRVLCGIGLGLITLVVWTSPIVAQTFTPTGSMTVPRMGHTATLLNNGKVLIAGGMSILEEWSSILASAELYDPATGIFTPTGSMTTARYFPTATLLNDGKVLFTGGNDGQGSIATAELYDPVTGTFTPTGSMTIDRYGNTATLLNNGKVLIAGGWTGDSSGRVVDSAELYDPATGIFTPTGSMTTARHFPTATLLNDGKVLLAGGEMGYWGSTLASAELYDPTTGTFTATGNMTTSRQQTQATLLDNGKVLVAGGWSIDAYPDTTIASADLYDPATGTFTPTGSMADAREMHQSTLLKDGKVLIAGGHTDPFVGDLAASELYDPTTGVFTSTGSMITPRWCFTATRLNNGKVLIAGGVFNYANLDNAELYTPSQPFSIDIDPWFKPNIINVKFKWAPIPVAILSKSGFDAPKIIDRDSLTFGNDGDENSLAFCSPLSLDVNGDKTRDLICFFYTGKAGFQCGDTKGILRGWTKGGTRIEGSDSVKIVPCK